MGYQNRIFLFVVEGKPPIKRRPRGRQHYTPKTTVADEARIVTAFRSYYDSDPRSEKRFSVEIKIFSERNFDGDNVEKAVLDALRHVLWENDRQVRQMFWVVLPRAQAEAQWDMEEGIVVKALEID